MSQVIVTYSKLIVDPAKPEQTEEVTRNFKTLAEAATDVNKEKNINNANGTNIVGPVTIQVLHQAPTASAQVATVSVTNQGIEKINIPVTKNWIDNPTWPGPRGDIQIHLLQDGVEYETWNLPGGKPSAGGKDTFTHTFKDLPKTDQYGNPHKYTITEDPVISLTSNAPYTSTIKGDINNPTEGFVVTNEWTQGEYFHLTGQKSWNDFTDKTRPASVNITLKQTNGTLVSNITLTSKTTGPSHSKIFPNGR